jgi:hypothetical protein
MRHSSHRLIAFIKKALPASRLPVQSLAVLAALAAAGGFKLYLWRIGATPFNADEAVVALMARHILQGDRPVFFYGQAYMGSLDAFLAAAGFSLLGQQVWVIRLVQGALYLGALLTTAWLGEAAFGKRGVGVWAAWLLAVPAVTVTLYTSVSLGGYGESLLVGNVILLLALRIATYLDAGQAPPAWLWLAWGFLAGAGLWIFGLTLVYSLPAGVFLAVKAANGLLAQMNLLQKGEKTAKRVRTLRKVIFSGLLLCFLGALAGALPWLLYGSQHGFAGLLGELRGGAIAGVERLPWLQQTGQHLASFLALGLTAIFGLRPPWAVHWLGLPLLPFVLLIWLVVLAYTVRSLLKRGPGWERRALLAGVIITLAAGFILTPFGGDPSGRYFLPLAVPLALFAADGLSALAGRLGPKAWALAALLLAHQLWGNLESMRLSPARITTQFYPVTQIDHSRDAELIEFLHRQGATRGYTNYWVAYPLAFLSQEELLFVPRLPYHPDFRYTERDDRFRPYLDEVESAGSPAYITTHHPALDGYLRDRFTALGVAWQEARIGDYQVFYALSEDVEAAEVGLGMDRASGLVLGEREVQP